LKYGQAEVPAGASVAVTVVLSPPVDLAETTVCDRSILFQGASTEYVLEVLIAVIEGMNVMAI
jgi:hypothetical protein